MLSTASRGLVAVGDRDRGRRLASILSARFINSVLFGVTSSDPITRWSTAGLLLIVVLASSWIPARRASHAQPMDALRRE